MKSINSLLITISNILLIPSVTFAACSNTAPPDDTTVTCSGSSTSPISVLGDNVTINILKGADITSSLSVPLIDISSGNSNVIINNDGSLNKTNTTVFRISGRDITVNNNSIINHSGGFFSYILLGITGSDNIRLINQGTVNYTGIGLPGGMLAGIYATSSSNNTVINQGTMNATGFSMIGVRLQYSSFMNNQGVFNFSADQGAAVKLENRSDSSLVNSGSIIVTDFTGTGGTAPTRYAVWSSPLLASTNTITNTTTGIISIDQGSIAVFGSSYVEIVENQGQIFGGLNLGANNDRFTNTGIIVGNVELGDGDDIVISSGTIRNSNVDLGLGTDSMTVSSSAVLENITTLDGGDDASSGDGAIDQLTFDGWQGDVPTVTNWENITFTNGAIGNLGSSRTITTELLTINNGASIISIGNSPGSYTVTGNLINNGSLTLADAEANDTFTVGGNYSGTGQLVLDTVLSNDNATSDRFIINGNSSGTTSLIIQSAGGAGAQTKSDGILVVQVDGTSSVNSFRLGNYVAAGAYEYDLLINKNHVLWAWSSSAKGYA